MSRTSDSSGAGDVAYTPPLPCLHLVRELNRIFYGPKPAYLDPAAGRGCLPRFTYPGSRWECFELDPGAAKVTAAMDGVTCRVANALDVDWPALPVICNPPFSLMEQFVRKCIEHSKRPGVPFAAVLMRSLWISDSGRYEWALGDHAINVGRIKFNVHKEGRLRGKYKAGDACGYVWRIYQGGASGLGAEIVHYPQPVAVPEGWQEAHRQLALGANKLVVQESLALEAA